VGKYYLVPNQLYDMNNPSDDAKRFEKRQDLERQQRRQQLTQRANEKTRLTVRRTEREILQGASSQAVLERADIHLAQDIPTSDPSLATECRLKKSLTFKDPTRSDKLPTVPSLSPRPIERQLRVQQPHGETTPRPASTSCASCR
jgi:hypothetical protein